MQAPCVINYATFLLRKIGTEATLSYRNQYIYNIAEPLITMLSFNTSYDALTLNLSTK